MACGSAFILHECLGKRYHYLRAKRYSSDGVFTNLIRLLKKQNLDYTIEAWTKGLLIKWKTKEESNG
jgi:hypothetical protein